MTPAGRRRMARRRSSVLAVRFPPPLEQPDLLRSRVKFERGAFAVEQRGRRRLAIPRRAARPWECRGRAPASRRGSSGCRAESASPPPRDQSISRKRDGGRSSAQTTAPRGICKSSLGTAASARRRDRADPRDPRSAPEDIRLARNCSPRSVRRAPTSRPHPPACPREWRRRSVRGSRSSSSKAT